MRKNFLSKVVVKVRAMAADTFGVEISTKDTEALLSFAQALGYVDGVRGKNGGYLVTDKGLEFIGENVQAFHAMEAKLEAQHEEELKQARKQANKARKTALAEAIADAA